MNTYGKTPSTSKFVKCRCTFSVSPPWKKYVHSVSLGYGPGEFGEANVPLRASLLLYTNAHGNSFSCLPVLIPKSGMIKNGYVLFRYSISFSFSYLEIKIDYNNYCALLAAKNNRNGNYLLLQCGDRISIIPLFCTE